MDVWADLGDDELRARLNARLADESFVDWLVVQRDNAAVAPLVTHVLDDD